MLIGEDYSVALLQETWTQELYETSTCYKISGYHSVFDSREDGYGGSAIFIKNSFNYRKVVIDNLSGNSQAVAIAIPKSQIVVVSVYLAPSVTVEDFEEDITKMFESLRNYRKVIIGGDWNAHHIAWGNASCDRKGGIFMELVNQYNWLVLNDGQSTFVPVQLNRRSTAIDVSLCSADLYGELQWTVLEYGVGSEHMAIQIAANHEQSSKGDKWIYNRKKIYDQLTTLDHTEVRSWEDLTGKVQRIYKNSRKRDKRTPKYWWSPEVEEAWKTKTQARREFNKVGSLENLIKFKKASALFQRRKKVEKEAKWKEFVEQISPLTSSKELWQKIGRLTGKKAHRKENNLLLDDSELAEKFLDLHFGQNNQVDTSGLGGSFATYDILDEPRWKNIIESKNSNSAPGEDKITYGMLRQLQPEVVQILLEDLNGQWRRGYPGEMLKTIKVVAIPKIGKDQSTLEGKRPISLVPTCTKVVNTAVLEELKVVLEARNILPPKSFGFRKGLSTNTCVSYVINKIMGNRRDGNLTSIIFVDLSNGFCSVKVDTLQKIMSENRVPSELNCWITNFLMNRKIVLQTNDKKLTRIISEGLPQGDVLSPTLFNVYTAQMHEIQVDGVELVQYADDFGIIVTAKSVEMLETKGQAYLDSFVETATTLNLTINPEKTKTILFQASNKSLDYKINGTVIETVRSHGYLGVVLDRSLTFGRHTKELKEKVNDRLNMVKVISGVKAGGHPETMLNIHKALIRSTLEYGSTVYNNAAKTNLTGLGVINNQSLRKATGCTKSTPLNTLLAISGLESLAIRHDYIAGKEIARNIAQQTAVGQQLIGTAIRNNTEENKISFMEKVFFKHFQMFDAIMPIIRKCPQYPGVTISPSLEGLIMSKGNTNPQRLKQLVLYAFNGTYKGRTRIFTDASKEGRKCGIGVYVERTNKRISFRLANEVSTTGAELIAIRVAMDIVEDDQLTDAVIYTDSRSACEILELARGQNEREELLDDILRKAIQWGVSLQWIPSHVGVNGKELADHLAKRGTTDGQVFLQNKISYKDAYWILKSNKASRTDEWYKEYAKDKGQKFFQIQQDFKPKPWFVGLNLTSQQIRLLNRLMAGHDWSKFWRHKMKLTDSPDCETCGELETAEHLILHCTK